MLGRRVLGRQVLAAALLSGAAWALGAAAPAAAADTLPEAIVEAYGSNPSLAAERARVRALAERVAQARAARLPSVTVQAQAGYDETESPTSFASIFGGGARVETEPRSAAVVADQTLFQGGAISGQIKSAKAQDLAGRAELQTAEQDLLLQAASVYMNLRRDREALAIRENNLKLLARQAEAADARFEVGEITRTDVAQAQARLAAARAQLAGAQAQLAASRAAFMQVIGDEPGELAPPPTLPLLPETEDEAVAMALASFPGLEAARFAEEAARAGVKVAKSSLLPRVGVQAQANTARDQGFVGQESDSMSITATVSAPIFTGGLNGARVREAHQTASQARMGVVAAERQAYERASSAWFSHEAAKQQLSAAEEQARAAELAYRGVEQEVMVGLRTTLDALDAEQELLNARLAVVDAARDIYLTGLQLAAATGELTLDVFDPAAPVYDPARYYDYATGWGVGWRLDPKGFDPSVNQSKR